jgi:WD40 repeat protein
VVPRERTAACGASSDWKKNCRRVSEFDWSAGTLSWLLKLRDATTGKVLWSVPHVGWCATFSPDGKTVFAGEIYGQVHLLDAATGKERSGFQARGCVGFFMALSPDGRTLATAGDKTIRLWAVPK